MKKKLIASITCLCMLLVMLLSSTLAWFTDQQFTESIMTVGKVKITQELTKDNKNIRPNDPFKHTVTITNDGNELCYVRTIFAFEDGDYEDKQGISRNVLAQITLNDGGKIVIPGVTDTLPKMQFTVKENNKSTLYTVGYYVHDEALNVGDAISPLVSFTLKQEADNAWINAVTNKVDKNYDILVLSQACQVAGMEGTYEDALNTSFGTITSVKCASWFGTMLDKDTQAYISTAEDLQEALNNGQTDITLMADIEVTESIVIPAPTMRSVSDAVVIDLNDKTMKSEKGTVIYNEGNLVLTGKGKIESTAQAYAIRVQQGNMLIDSADIEVVGAFGAVSIFNGADVTINGGSYYAAGIDGKTSHCVYVGGGTLIVNGGTFDSGYSSEGIDTICGSATANVTLNGGTFYASELGESFFLKNVIVKGGTYQYAPTGIASGHTVVAHSNGTYSVVPEVENVTLSATEFAGIYAGDTAKTYYVFDKTGLMNLNELFKTVDSGEGVPTIINLEADVDLSGEDWKPIDAMWIIFNGNGHTISNLTASGMDAAGRRSGFWAYAGGVVINDLTLENVTVNGSQAGIFAGTTEGTRINNCFLKGNNVVNFVAGVEEWNGIGAICGIATTPAINVTIVEGATVTLNRGDMVTAFGCTYIDDLTGHLGTNSGTITNNGTVTATGSITYAVSNAAELEAAVKSGATDIFLNDGEYNVANCGGKTLTLTGSKNAVLKVMNEGEDGCDYGFGGPAGVGNITFNGLTIDTTANTGNYKGYAYMKGTFNDCNFVGAYSLNNANDFVFNRCTFDFKNGYFWTWGAKSVTFDGCTFNGNSKAILAHGSASTVITINNCKFAATEKGYTGAGDNTAVVEMDPVGSNTYTINFTGENTITDAYAGWTRVKDDSTGHIINGLN